MCGIRTEVFSIGMGFRLFGFNKKHGFTFGKLPVNAEDKSQTNTSPEVENDWYCDYRISLLPIGGYVKVAGMVDESFDTDFAKSEPKNWEFRTKNTFQKVFVLSAGVIMNFLLAVAVFSGIIFSNGSEITKVTSVGYVLPGSIAEKSGFVQGDRIISVHGHQIYNWQDIRDRLTIDEFGETKKLVVENSGVNRTLTLEGKVILDSLKSRKSFEDATGLYPKYLKLYVSDVFTTMPAGVIGMKTNDTILQVNNDTIYSRAQFVKIIESNKQIPLQITWKRQNQILSDTITPNAEGKIGVGIYDVFTGPIIKIQYSVFESVIEGYTQTVNAVSLLIHSIWQIIEGKVSVKQSLGGPIFIAKSAADQAEQGLANFLTFTALLSISLAVINILPIPALDGGHILFILIEGIIRREVSVKIKLAFQQVGIVLIIALMVFIFYIDLTR